MGVYTENPGLTFIYEKNAVRISIIKEIEGRDEGAIIFLNAFGGYSEIWFV